MHIFDKLYHLAQTAGGGEHQVLSDLMAEEVMGNILSRFFIEFPDIRGNAEDYPEVIWNVVYNTYVRDVVHSWLHENHPHAWFKAMYLPRAEQIALLGMQ